MDPESWDRLQTASQEDRRIDVWWQKDATSRLMLLLAHLMTRRTPWNKAVIRVLTLGEGVHIEAEKELLKKTLEDIRIDAIAEVVVAFDPDTIVQQSADASFVFLPMKIHDHRILDPTGKSFERTLPRLPVSVVVMAAEDIDLDAAPEEGLAAQVAQATDALEAARKRAAAAKKRAVEKKAAMERLSRQLEALEEKGISGAVPLDTHGALKEKIEDAESGAEKAFRRAAKAKAKADDAEKTADALAPGSTAENDSDEKS
jgi:hypothetical protein